ncbi:hypothetical protein SOVF_195340 [Spinacia oleracea]|nr:hypothetical protein SOVF_195340 [Spinacia oleracea]
MKRPFNSSPPPPPPPPPPYSDIPIEFLLQMGSSEINLHGVQITTHVINNVEAVNKHITELRTYLECNTKVVGLDLKMKIKPDGGSYNYKSQPDILILCVFRRCLIIHLDSIVKVFDVPKSLEDFVNDPMICFVGATTLPEDQDRFKFSYPKVGVTVGDLAARVLRKPGLTESSLADVAKEVGVLYKGGSVNEIVIKSSMDRTVLTDEQIKIVLSEAYAYYQIGYKLLNSLW